MNGGDSRGSKWQQKCLPRPGSEYPLCTQILLDRLSVTTQGLRLTELSLYRTCFAQHN